ncbi:MAG: radical SAM protein [Desulfurococcales archaeon]|nr:radical SAM protein [Desulfurococcales archaeon]
MLRPVARIHGRPLLMVEKPVPLMGHIAFGVIDRGSNIVQVRPYTWCPHSCIFCSVDAGPASTTRQAEYMVDPEWLVEWVGRVAEYKGGGVEALIDGVGEPLSHPGIPDIVRMLKDAPGIDRVAIETHGGFLSKKLAESLDKAGLDRINLSIDSVDGRKARKLAGVDWYDPARILGIAEWIIDNTGIDVVLTPVVLPGVNEDDMLKLIEWAKSVGAGVKAGWPTGVLIQNFQIHKWGRKPQGVKPWSWHRFYKWLRRLEERTRYRLLVEPWELGFKKAPKTPEIYRVGDRVKARIIGPGWHRGEQLAVDARMQRVIAVVGREPMNPGKHVTLRIIRSKDNIYVAR